MPDTNARGGSDQPHRFARAVSCEEPETSAVQALGSLETGLDVLQSNSNTLNNQWVSSRER